MAERVVGMVVWAWRMECGVAEPRAWERRRSWHRGFAIGWLMQRQAKPQATHEGG